MTKLKIFKSILYSFSRNILHESPNKGKGIVDKKPYIPKPFIVKVKKQFKHIIEFEFFNEADLGKYLTLRNPELVEESQNERHHSKATVKAHDPLRGVLGDLKKKMDRVFKINERKYEDNWNQSAEELISFLKSNFGFEHFNDIEPEDDSEEESSSEEEAYGGKYGGMFGALQHDDGSSDDEESGEEEKDEAEGEVAKEEAKDEEHEVMGMFDFEKSDLEWRVDQ